MDADRNLIQLFRDITSQLKDGDYNAIDLSQLRGIDPQTAENLEEVIANMKMAEETLVRDDCDVPLVSQHLTHICKTTENGVMEVLNISETFMGEAETAQRVMDKVHEVLHNHPELQKDVLEANRSLDNVRAKCFAIITALEFEDVNRQLLQRIITRIDEVHAGINALVGLMNFKSRMERKDSGFLERLRHITDIEDNERQSQEMIDVLFEEF